MKTLDHKALFRTEAFELLEELESAMLELEENPGDEQLIDRVFRAMHTIKGSGAMAGFTDVAAFAHGAETTFDEVRQGNLAISRNLVDLMLSSCDLLRKMIAGEETDKALESKLTNDFKNLLPAAEEKDSKSAGNSDGQSSPATQHTACNSTDLREENHGKTGFVIRYIPAPDVFSFGLNPLSLIDELRTLGECKVSALIDTVPNLENLDPESCVIGWEVHLETEKSIDDVKDVFLFTGDDCVVEISNENSWQQTDAPGLQPDSQKADDTSNEVQPATGTGPASIPAVGKKNTSAIKNKSNSGGRTTDSMRVSAEKLDALVDLVGELVTLQARLGQIVTGYSDSQLSFVSEQFEYLAAELRDNTMSIRMMPIGSSFDRFKRLVRDLSGSIGKQVRLETDGSETELDKTVIERLNDPLVHIIRNSIDHGIEPPETRRISGKNPEGRLQLSASHEGGSVLIRISDDGAGLNPEKIREIAEKRGLINSGEELREKDLFNLIFQPGFSTAGKITDVSGRGVGMDVVKTAIDSLQGDIDIDSTMGQGTTVTLRIPLTLAIIDGLLAQTGDDTFILPLSVIDEIMEITSDQLQRDRHRKILEVRGMPIPYVTSRSVFDIDGDGPSIQQVLVCQVEGQQVGFVVDNVLGEHQTVIKNLGRAYSNIKEFSGATVLADGSLALIIDISRIIQIVDENQETNQFRDRLVTA